MPVKHKLGLAFAGCIMVAVSLCNVTVSLLLGKLVNSALGMRSYVIASEVLVSMRSFTSCARRFNVARRYLVENSCTRIHRDMCVRVVNHLMRVNLASLSKDKVGSLHGRIYRSVEGYVRFLRLSFLDSVPAILTGLFALIAAVCKQPVLGLIMIGVIPSAVFLTIRQLISQKGVRLKLLRSCDDIDGAMVEQLGGIEYVRSRQHLSAGNQAIGPRRREAARHGDSPSIPNVAVRLRQGAQRRLLPHRRPEPRHLLRHCRSGSFQFRRRR